MGKPICIFIYLFSFLWLLFFFFFFIYFSLSNLQAKKTEKKHCCSVCVYTASFWTINHTNLYSNANTTGIWVAAAAKHTEKGVSYWCFLFGLGKVLHLHSVKIDVERVKGDELNMPFENVTFRCLFEVSQISSTVEKQTKKKM